MQCPPILDLAIISDNAEFAARLSSIYNRPGYYLPVIDGPRMSRPDGSSEAIRRNNAIAKAQIRNVLLGELSTKQYNAMSELLPSGAIQTSAARDLDSHLLENPTTSILKWGRNNIGIGLLKALRDKKIIEFGDGIATSNAEVNGKTHLVVCEAGEPVSEVIAANYAFSVDADLLMIPKVDKKTAESITEEFYSLYDLYDKSATDRLAHLANRIRELCPNITVPNGGSITFLTSHIPFGFGFPEIPSTHLTIYPDLGVSVLNGFAAGNDDTEGTRCAVLVDPGQTQAQEVAAIAKLFAKRGVFVRGYPSKTANVRDITNTVELFPYDFLLFATHCGDASGYRFTYQYDDVTGKSRCLVVDTAIGVAQTDDPEMLNVMQFERFHELDGVSWNDPQKSEKVDVGSAISDFIRLNQEKSIEPIHRELIPRVLGSAVLKMFDDNYIAMPRQLADRGSPVVFNNACASWHQLSTRFMFAGARAYIGTLFPVTSAEAAQVAEFFVEQEQNVPLAEALWRAQNKTYENSQTRRPYVINGVYSQNLRVLQTDVPSYIQARLEAALKGWTDHTLKSATVEDSVDEIKKYYRREIDWFKNKWRKSSRKKPMRRAMRTKPLFRH